MKRKGEGGLGCGGDSEIIIPFSTFLETNVEKSSYTLNNARNPPQHCFLRMRTNLSHNNPPSQSLQKLHTSPHNPLIHFLHPHPLNIIPSKSPRQALFEILILILIHDLC